MSAAKVSSIIFDLDGTLTMTPSPWRHIHQRLGVWENQASGHLDAWLGGRITYDQFCTSDTGLWSGRPLPELEGYLSEIEINRHVPGMIQKLTERGIPSIIISSGFTSVARRIQTQYGWEPLLIYANELVDGPQVKIRVSADKSSPISKKAHADEALRLVGGDLATTLVVSDSVHDLEQLCDCAFHLHIREEDDLLRTLDYLD